MEKDLFDYFEVPTKDQLRDVDCIDDFYGIPKLNIPNNFFATEARDYLLNTSIINYNNEVIVAKTYYAFAKNFLKLYEKEKVESYDFWARKFIEQTIKELYSIYDKSMHIINHMYDLKVVPDMDFKKNIRNKLKTIDRKFYMKINSVFSKLYDDKYKSLLRDDITHNISELFLRYSPIYKSSGITSWELEEPLSIEEAISIIKEISLLLSKQVEAIIEKLKEIYPKKGSKEYNEKIDNIKKKINKMFEETENLL